MHVKLQREVAAYPGAARYVRSPRSPPLLGAEKPILGTVMPSGLVKHFHLKVPYVSNCTQPAIAYSPPSAQTTLEMPKLLGSAKSAPGLVKRSVPGQESASILCLDLQWWRCGP